MGTNPSAVTLTADDLNETDWKLFRLLEDGRVTPSYAADRLDISREYASDRLTRFREHGLVNHPASGLYELNVEEVPEDDD